MEHNHTSDERHPIHSTFTESGYRSIQDRETQSRSSNGSANDSGYTELLSGSVPCPTCRGLGNVPKGSFYMPIIGSEGYLTFQY